MKMKNNIKLGIITTIGFLLMTANIKAQNITSSSWTEWLTMKQANCIQRAKVSLKLAGIKVTESQNWYVVGKALNHYVRIKCIADANTTSMVNVNATRMLVDVEVGGPNSNASSLDNLRNCIKEFMLTGVSNCWQTGAGPGKFLPIAWTDTPQTLKLWGGNGQIYIFYCPPNGQIRPVWGSVTYTHNSSICTAAVHASRITRGGGGNVRIQMDSGPRFFNGVKRAGITSQEYRGAVRAFGFMDPPLSVNAPVVTIYGKTWNETESGWTGVWTRVGFTNVFSALWTRGSQQVKALLTIQISGNNVNIERRDSASSGWICNYTGTLSADRKNVSGTYSCTKIQGAGTYGPAPWQATINR